MYNVARERFRFKTTVLHSHNTPDYLRTHAHGERKHSN